MATFSGRSLSYARNMFKPKSPSHPRNTIKSNISPLPWFNRSTLYSTVASPSVSSSISPIPLDLESAGKLINTSIGHFDIRNLLREETILSSFALEKVSSLQSGLSSTSHPIISVAQEIFQDSETKLINSLGGFTLLLLAKSIESIPSFVRSAEIWEKQKIFAECYEMIDKAMYIHHQSIVNLPTSTSEKINSPTDARTLNILNNGNKLAVLGGDYLFSFGIIRLASSVRHANVFDFIGASIDEFCVNQFDNYQREVCSSIKPKLDMNMETWEKYGGYCSAKLAAYSAQYIAVISNLTSIRYEQAAFDFGYNLKLKWNLEEDIKMFTESNGKRFNSISAPLIKYIEKNGKFKNYLSQLDWENDEAVNRVREIILSSDVIDECQKLIQLYSEKCIKMVQLFPDCPSRRVLESIARGDVPN